MLNNSSRACFNRVSVGIQCAMFHGECIKLVIRSLITLTSNKLTLLITDVLVFELFGGTVLAGLKPTNGTANIHTLQLTHRQ